MKKLTIFLLTIFLITGATIYSQEKMTINQQIFTKVDLDWKLIDQKTGNLFNLSDELTIQFKSSPSQEKIKQLEKAYGMKLVRSNKLGFYDFRPVQKQNLIDIYRQLLKNPIVKDVFANTIGKYILIPNDTQYTAQWYLEQASDADIDISNAWDITTGNSSVVVAILDSGSDWTHQDLGFGTDSYQNIHLNTGEDSWTNPNNPATGNGVDDDGNGYIDDWKGWDFGNSNNDSRGPYFHGTHVAGIIGAKTNNGIGISGIAGGNNSPGAGLMIVGVGDYGPNSAAMDDAILYAMDNGAKIIQLSLTVAPSSAIDAALQAAYISGVFIVCSSGNGSSTSIGYPSSNSYVFSVGATTQTDIKAGFSNSGTDLDLAAPGVSILSTQIGNTYGYSDGTSFSSPIVSATVALMLSVDATLTNEEIEYTLKCTADKVGSYNYNWNPSKQGHSKELGYGRLNAYQAVLAVSTSDIYTRDTPTDNGVEPSSGIMWASPDIWVRNDDDGGLTNENPEYKTSSPNWVYIRINNKDCSKIDDASVKLYFSKASTGLSWPLHWNNYYEFVGSNSVLHGDYIGSTSIPMSIQEEVIVKIPWYPPNPADYINDVHHFCLLSRIESASDPIGTEGNSVNTNTINNNNISWKNVSVYDLNQFDSNAPWVFIRNVDKKNQSINLNLNLTENNTGVAFKDIGKFYIKADKKLERLLEKSKLEGIKRVDKQTYQIIYPEARIDNILAKAFETYSLKFYIIPNQELPEGKSITYDIIQTDARQNNVGGERYTIGNFKKKKSSNQNSVIDENNNEKNFYSIVPNPTSGEINILFDKTYSGISITVKSITGQDFGAKYLQKGNEVSLNINGPKGLYFVSVLTDEGFSKVSKVLKE
ncbi:subtilisin-like serine protease [Aequorivita sublithincola DSM 14238]|uniref:Subtilisin-like serine protease n=1 Tax=Aequorivita sublithincola (strain DSM 14238 / LMG 21431 / ACAM 643 / 9-3) TaxID=746697 RepID=I3YZX7_AEQSU|nr:S8 family peptidase [Aequorivita sublithincola]AFL82545.1 subtilisin-like serine protease [Aequorivita sublithincola DSM 14238]